MIEFRCSLCGKLLMRYTGTNFTIEAKCTRCGTLNTWSFSYKEFTVIEGHLEPQTETNGELDGRIKAK